jgi:hypothetical protein
VSNLLHASSAGTSRSMRYGITKKIFDALASQVYGPLTPLPITIFIRIGPIRIRYRAYYNLDYDANLSSLSASSDLNIDAVLSKKPYSIIFSTFSS